MGLKDIHRANNLYDEYANKVSNVTVTLCYRVGNDLNRN